MGEFLTGWRRRLGCVLLIAAGLLMSVWLRGFFEEDAYRFGSGRGLTLVTITSSRYGLVWSCERFNAPIGWAHGWRTRPIADAEPFNPLECSVDVYIQDWRRQLFGFDMGHFHSDYEESLTFYAVRQWAVVTPLAVLSAILILWPHRRTSRERAL